MKMHLDVISVVHSLSMNCSQMNLTKFVFVSSCTVIVLCVHLPLLRAKYLFTANLLTEYKKTADCPRPSFCRISTQPSLNAPP